jgi:hypothetical protein
MNTPENFYNEGNSTSNSIALKLLLIIPLFLLLSFFIFYELQKTQQRRKEAETADHVLVCIAKSDILEGEKISTDHIGFRSIPIKYKSRYEYFWKDREQLLGSIVTVKILAGTHFIDFHFQRTLILPKTGEGTFDVEKLLQDLKENNDPDKRKKSVLLLGQLGSSLKKALPVLLSLVDDPDFEVRDAVHQALKSISGTE